MAPFAQSEISAAVTGGAILKIIIGRGVRGLLNYQASKATDMYGKITNKPIYSNTSDTPRGIAKEFAFLRMLRPNLTRAVGHLIIAPKSPFKTKEELIRAVDLALKEHGIDKDRTIFACFFHTDTDHPHIHIAFCRVRTDGSVVSDSNSYRKNERAARLIEAEFNLSAPKEKPRSQRPINSQAAYSMHRREKRIYTSTREIRDESKPPPKPRRLKMPTKNDLQEIEALIKQVLADPDADCPPAFKQKVDAALAAAGLEAAHVRFHRRGAADNSDAEISGLSLMLPQGTSIAASNISRDLSWMRVKAALDANAASARRRRREESADLAEEALGFLLLRPAQTTPAQAQGEALLTPRRVLAGDEPAAAPSWSWPATATAMAGIYETSDALSIHADLIATLSPAEMQTLVCQLLDRAEKKWGAEPLQAEGLLVDHPHLFAALVLEAAQRPGLHIAQPPELVAAIETARTARAAAGAELSRAAPPPLDFLAFSAAEPQAAQPAPAPAVAAAPAPAPVDSAPAPLTKDEAEKAKTANLAADLRARAAHARALFSSPAPVAMSAFQLERLDAPALRARLVALEGSAEQARWIAGANVRHESEQYTLGGNAAERVLQAYEAAAPAGRPRRTFVARGASVEAAQALSAARGGVDRTGPFRWLTAVSRKSEIDRLEALARSSKAQWEHAKSEFLQEHAEEIKRFEARQALFFVENQLRTALSGSGPFETNASWTPEALAGEKQKILDRLVVSERREHDELLRKQERDRLIERERSGDASRDDEERQQVRYERHR